MEEAMDGPMLDEHRKILRKNQKILERDLQPRQLLPHLTEILSPEDDECIRAEKTRTEEARMLLSIIPRKGSRAFEYFVKSLWKFHPHLAYTISKEANLEVPREYEKTDKRIMPPEIKEKLRCSQLREILRDTDENEIYRKMKMVLTDADNQMINSHTTEDAKREEFLSILPCKGLKAFDHFIEILKSQGHHEICVFLIGESAGQKDLNDHNTEGRGVIAHPVYETPISAIKDRLDGFYLILNKDNNWKKLTQELQLSQDDYLASPNPTPAVIADWIDKKGDAANISALREALRKQRLNQSMEYLESALSNADKTDSSANMNAIIERTQNLSIVPAKESTIEPVPYMLQDLNPPLVKNLRTQIISETNQASNPAAIITIEKGNLPIRKVTMLLRQENLTESIKWMKTNLPAGVTGPLLDEKLNVRDMSYRVRSKLTKELTVGGNWKFLAERIGIQPTDVKYFDERFPNPADKILENWETRRNSTIGDLYDILVDLEMEVIADLL